jgi:hypothetical protein
VNGQSRAANSTDPRSVASCSPPAAVGDAQWWPNTDRVRHVALGVERQVADASARTAPSSPVVLRMMRSAWLAAASVAFAVLAACSSSATTTTPRTRTAVTPVAGGSGFIPRLPGTRPPSSSTTAGTPPPTAEPGRPRFLPPSRPPDPSNLADWNTCAATLNQTAIRSFGRQSNSAETLRYCGPEPPPPTKSTPAVYNTCVQKVNSTSENVLGRVATPAELSSMCGPPP